MSFEVLPAPGTGGAACGDEVCVTCADEALPAVVRTVGDDGLAMVERDGEATEISVELLDAVRPGDTVLVHGGVAIARVTP